MSWGDLVEEAVEGLFSILPLKWALVLLIAGIALWWFVLRG